MALTDILFPEAEDDFILEIPSASYAGALTDIILPSSSGPFVLEVPAVSTAKVYPVIGPSMVIRTEGRE
jgi:hypothetical protein